MYDNVRKCPNCHTDAPCGGTYCGSCSGNGYGASCPYCGGNESTSF